MTIRRLAALSLLGASVVAGGIATAGPIPVEGVRRPVPTKNSVVAPPPPAFEVSAPTISAYDPTTCKIRWSAAVKNISSESAVPLNLQAVGTKNAVEVGSGGGTTIGWMAKGQSSTGGLNVDPFGFKTGGFAAPTHFAVALMSSSVRLTTSAPTPLPPIPSFADTVTVQANMATDVWSATLTNKGSPGYPTIELTVQSHASNSLTGPWDASGGPAVPDCLPSQKDVVVSGRRLAGHRYLKIGIVRVLYTVDKKVESRAVVWERILDSAPAAKQVNVAPAALVKQ